MSGISEYKPYHDKNCKHVSLGLNDQHHTHTQKAGSMAQIAECLPAEHEALNSNPRTTKREKQKVEQANFKEVNLFKVHIYGVITIKPWYYQHILITK